MTVTDNRRASESRCSMFLKTEFSDTQRDSLRAYFQHFGGEIVTYREMSGVDVEVGRIARAAK